MDISVIVMLVISVNCFDPSMITAPAMAPMAAAVTPSIKAFKEGCSPYFLK